MDSLRAASEKLQSAFARNSEVAYQQAAEQQGGAAPEGGPAGPQPGPEGGDEGVIDAEFRESD